jgi:hypothetical protein
MQIKVSSQQHLAPSEEDVLDAYVMRMPDKNLSLPVSRRREQKRNGDKKNDGDIIRLFQAPSDAFRSLTDLPSAQTCHRQTTYTIFYHRNIRT